MIFTDQSLMIRLTTGLNLVGASAHVIRYEKPNGVTGQWLADIDGESLTYITSNTDIDRPGVWKLQAFCVIGGLNKIGAIARVPVDKRI